MARQLYEIRLKSSAGYGKHAPPKPIAAVLSSMPDLAGRAVRMAFQGTGSVAGRHAAWYTRATDIRFVGIDGTTDTVLRFEVPVLGEAAEELYAQGELWSTRPDPDQTAFDLLGSILDDVRAENSDSERFDTGVLNSIYHLRHGLEGGFEEMVVQGTQDNRPSVLDKGVVASARELSRLTPAPRQIRVAGVLDMLRASTQTFAIELQNGETVRGTYLQGEMEELKELFRQNVTVLGKAVFRPSGHVLRIDAQELVPSGGGDDFFSRMPVAVPRKLEGARGARVPLQTHGMAAIFGKWPGDETDEEIAEALRLIS